MSRQEAVRERTEIERAEVECLHERITSLGSNPGMTFARCSKCEAVLVSDGTTWIAIPPLRKAG